LLAGKGPFMAQRGPFFHFLSEMKVMKGSFLTRRGPFWHEEYLCPLEPPPFEEFLEDEKTKLSGSVLEIE